MNIIFERGAASEAEGVEHYWSHRTPALRMSTEAVLNAFAFIHTQARREIARRDMNDSNVHIQERLREDIVMWMEKKTEEVCWGVMERRRDTEEGSCFSDSASSLKG